MADLQSIELDLGPMVREAMINGLADLVEACPQFTHAVILELLSRQDVSRTMIAEAIGEEGLRVSDEEEEQAAIYEANKGEGCEPPVEESWDEIAQRVIAEMKDTPGGRGEV